MKVEAIVKFQDLEEKKIREIGEQFTVSKERYKVLEERGLVKEAAEQKEAVEKE